MIAALVVRYIFLKLGGASTVREKLYPMATGLFLGTVVYELFNICVRGLLGLLGYGQALQQLAT